MNRTIPTLTLLSLLFLGACSTKKQGVASDTTPTIEVRQSIKGGQDVMAMPRATVFKMNGDYADKVAVTLNPDGTLAYYPAPTDITKNSSPYPLGDGWYLNRQGIGQNSVFTSYTFDDYRKLKQAPSHEEIIASIIPGSGVTDFRELPILASDAIKSPQLCKAYLKK